MHINTRYDTYKHTYSVPQDIIRALQVSQWGRRREGEEGRGGGKGRRKGEEERGGGKGRRDREEGREIFQHTLTLTSICRSSASKAAMAPSSSLMAQLLCWESSLHSLISKKISCSLSRSACRVDTVATLFSFYETQTNNVHCYKRSQSSRLLPKRPFTSHQTAFPTLLVQYVCVCMDACM